MKHRHNDIYTVGDIVLYSILKMPQESQGYDWQNGGWTHSHSAVSSPVAN